MSDVALVSCPCSPPELEPSEVLSILPHSATMLTWQQSFLLTTQGLSATPERLSKKMGTPTSLPLCKAKLKK
jgi:hypothetical protein